MAETEYVSTYRWLDLFGRPRVVDIFVEDNETRRISAYAREDVGDPVLVAVLDPDGKFLRLASAKAAMYGLDTAAAWNNLFDLCRAAQGHRGAY